MFKAKPQVLVAGAGPVGLFTALALAKHGVRVQIVDTGLRTCSHSYALALHPQTVKLLGQFGLAEAILEHAYPVVRLGLYDSTGRRAHIDLNHSHDSTCLAVVRQSFLEDLLEKALHDQGVAVSWRHEAARLVQSVDGVEVTIHKLVKESRGYVIAHDEWVVDRSTNLAVPFVIGADGHNSQVRRALGLEFPEAGAAQYYAVFEFKTDAELDHETRLVLGDRTTDVLWPLPDGYCRWSFQLPDYISSRVEHEKDDLLAAGFGHVPSRRLKDSGPHAEWDYLPVLSEQNLGALIAERAPWFDGSIEKFTWRTVVRFERRLVCEFGRGRMWLAGDAAHLTGPAGVQSMNLGLLEGAELADAMRRMLLEAGTPHSLTCYNQRWSRVWRQLHGLESALMATPEADAWIARVAGRLLPCLPAHGNELAVLAGHVGLELSCEEVASR